MLLVTGSFVFPDHSPVAGDIPTQCQDLSKVCLDGSFSELLPFFCFYPYQRNYIEDGRCYKLAGKKVLAARIRKGEEYLPQLQVQEEIKARRKSSK